MTIVSVVFGAAGVVLAPSWHQVRSSTDAQAKAHSRMPRMTTVLATFIAITGRSPQPYRQRHLRYEPKPAPSKLYRLRKRRRRPPNSENRRSVEPRGFHRNSSTRSRHRSHPRMQDRQVRGEDRRGVSRPASKRDSLEGARCLAKGTISGRQAINPRSIRAYQRSLGENLLSTPVCFSRTLHTVLGF